MAAAFTHGPNSRNPDSTKKIGTPISRRAQTSPMYPWVNLPVAYAAWVPTTSRTATARRPVRASTLFAVEEGACDGSSCRRPEGSTTSPPRPARLA